MAPKAAPAGAVKLEDLSSFGDLIPAGIEFNACGSKIEAKSTKQKEDGTGGGKAYLSVTFRVLNGDHEGLDATKTYFLSITKSTKNGKLYGKGVMELCSDMTTIGKPLPKDYPFQMSPTLADVQALSKLVAERVKKSATPIIKFKTVAERQQKKNEEGNYVDAFNDDGSPMMRTKYLIIGTGKGEALETAAAPAPVDTVDEVEPEEEVDAVDLL